MVVVLAVQKLIFIVTAKIVNMNQPVSEASIETLHKLGLTVLEAKVFTTLVCIGSKNVRSLARYLDIARCEVYRVVASLEDKGLVEKQLASPTVYKAVALEDAIQILLLHKKEEYDRLDKETSELLKKAKALDKMALTDDTECDLIISKGKIIPKRLASQLKATHSSFEAISTWKTCSRMLCNNFGALKVLLKNGVHIKILTDLPTDDVASEILHELNKNPTFEIKYSKTPLTPKLAIRDREEINMCFSETDSSPNLWSNNSIFVRTFTQYFDFMWRDAFLTFEYLKEKRSLLLNQTNSVQSKIAT